MKNLVNPNPDFWRGKKVFLTGNTGFKGAWMAIWLSKMGAQVTGFSLEEMVSQPSLFALVGNRTGKTIYGDLRDANAIAQAVAQSNPDIVIHMAAQSLVLPSYEDPIRTYATNVMGTLHLLEAVRQCETVRAFIVVTSDKCYENNNWHWGYKETDPIGGSDPYSSSKGCAELLISSYRRSFFMGKVNEDNGIALGSVRAGNVIGGGDWALNRLIPDIVQSFQNGDSVVIRNPHATRPWQHVMEPLSGYLVLAEKLFEGEKREEFAEGWNFGPHMQDTQPVEHIVSTMTELWGDGAEWRLDDRPHGYEAKYLRVDSSKAYNIMGWQSRLSIYETLKWTLSWYKDFLNGKCPFELCETQIDAYVNLGKTRKI